jgi:serine protease Do
MGANTFCPKTNLGRARLTVTTAAAVAFLAMAAPAAARGPDGIADVAEQVIDAVIAI